MEKEQKKGYVTYRMEDGTEVKMTLTFGTLMRLRSQDKTLYDKTNMVIVKGIEDVAQMATVLFAGYVCANREEKEIMTYSGFMDKMNMSIRYNMEVVGKLVEPSKNSNSSKYF